MSVGVNLPFESEFIRGSRGDRSVAPTAADSQEPGAFLAAVDGVIAMEQQRRRSVSASQQQHGAGMQKHKFLLEDGDTLKFPMDEEIMQELLCTVKSKIAQLKQLKDSLDLN